MVECWLPYDETEIHVSIPLREFLGVVEPKIGSVIREVTRGVREATERPVGCPSLVEIVQEASKISIGVDGSLPPRIITQAVSGLSKVIQEERGLKDVTIVVGVSPRRREKQHLSEILRRALPHEVTLYIHGIDSAVEGLGMTTQGTTVRVSRPFIEGDVRIAVGEFHPDPLTGFKGPYNVILPKLSDFKTIEMSRRLYYQGSTGPGVIDENPLLVESQEATRLTGVDATLLLVTDHMGEVIDLLFGDVEAVWEKTLTEYHDLYSVRVDSADVYVVSPGGGRFDFDLYHSLWALKWMEKSEIDVRIILTAECRDGLGAPALSKLSRIERLTELKRRHMLGGEALHLLRSIQRRAKVLLVSALPRHLADPLGLRVYAAANDALEAVEGGKTLVIPYGLSIT